MSDKSTNSGISFTGLLQIAFIVLKLLNKIDWSWWWVLAPTWVGIAILILVCIVFGTIAGYSIWLAKEVREKRSKEIDKLHKEIQDFRNSWPKVENSPTDNPAPKSKWQQRLDEMKNRKQ